VLPGFPLSTAAAQLGLRAAMNDVELIRQFRESIRA
jgi:hypothetical protein